MQISASISANDLNIAGPPPTVASPLWASLPRFVNLGSQIMIQHNAMQPAQCKTKDDCLQWILSHLHWIEYTKTDEMNSEEWFVQANSDRMGFVVIEIYKQKMTGRWAWIVGEEYGKPIRLTKEFKIDDISEDLTSLFDQMSRTYQRAWNI